MNLNDLCEWSISPEGWGPELERISRGLVVRDFSSLQSIPAELNLSDIDWQKLLLVASILAQSTDRRYLEAALTIAQAGILLSQSILISNSSLVILNQLFNHRTVSDAVTKGFISQSYLSNLGVSARMLAFREEIESKVFSATSEPLSANRFQIEFWNSVNDNDWLYALAPTASGKSFIVLKYIVEQVAVRKATVIIYVAPTRALVSEIEQNLRAISQGQNIIFSVSSVPIKELVDAGVPCIYVFTQERLHIFLNTVSTDFTIDILVIDEVQKLSDGMRGVILQDAIERVLRINEKAKIVFLSPNAENPGYLFRDTPTYIKSKIVDKDQPMVTQNMLWATQRGPESFNWKLELKYGDDTRLLGHFDLIQRPMTIAKKMAMVAVALSGNSTGNMIYANEPSEAEDIAEFIAELIESEENDKLNALSNLAKEGIHKNFKLVETVKKGVAFHYGNMPSLLREEIEELFNAGNIKFLICTSTLIEGVNLSCKTIYIHGPRKGKSTPMSDQDFWNLAGRAGRWGKEFHGNIVCIDPHIWKVQPPKRAKFFLKKQTDEALKDNGLIEYIGKRSFDTTTINDSKNYESVLAYLLTTQIRDGGLTAKQFVDHYSGSFLFLLNERLIDFTEKIDIPREVIEKHSGISAVSMQTLLNYFRERYSNDKKPISNLIPLTPETDGAYENMEGILRRIHLKLYPGFGFGKQYRHYALLILNWMQGYTLRRLIEDAIKFNKEEHEQKGKKLKNIHAVIRDTMKEVEEFARFKAPKYISCYTDILKIFLQEQNKLDLYPKDYPFDLFLEFGVMSKTLLSLVSLGLSRMSATELGDLILSTELDKEQTLAWIKENINKKEIPDFVRREIDKKILNVLAH